MREAPFGGTARLGPNAARRIFTAAGTDLGNVVRVLQFHSNLTDFHATYTEWESAVGDAGLPFSALEVAGDLFVPGASVIVDLWGHVPAAIGS